MIDTEHFLVVFA